QLVRRSEVLTDTRKKASPGRNPFSLALRPQFPSAAGATRLDSRCSDAHQTLLRLDENLAFLRSIWRADHPLDLHRLHDLGCAVVANCHLALEPRSRATLSIRHDAHRFVEARVEIGRLLLRPLFVIVGLEYVIVVDGRTLTAQ